jgi:hypothetical protein
VPARGLVCSLLLRSYLLHESGVWHEGLGKWVFPPRRVSVEPYDDVRTPPTRV